ncbi:MAG TPA: endonuclease/exonuclease/phosphatase family protein [Tepidisphaeraceae bacterium]|jgi:endonuclease/exonuclease/phosphatase family metal-dependent hydrolase
MLRKLRRRIGLLAISVLFVAMGNMRWPTGHWEGGPVDERSAESPAVNLLKKPSHLRLASFNIHSCVGLDSKFNVQRTADILRGYDLVALQEVQGPGLWWEDDADELGEKLGVAEFFSPTELRWWHPWFGNGVLTRTRIEHWERMELPCGFDDAYRNVLLLKVPFGAGSLNVVMAHLGKGRNREWQFPIVAEMFLRVAPPAVLMGDLNTRPWDPMMQRLLKEPGVEDPIAMRLAHPVDRCEFILVRGARWRDAGLVENDASDHPVIWVEVEAP